MPARRLALVLFATGLLALGACSDDAGTLDASATQRAVGQAVAAEVEPKVTSTRCPEEIERKDGAAFTCTVVLQGAGTLPVTVTQVDGDGKLEVEPDAAVVTQERIVAELKDSLKQQFDRNFQVACEADEVAVREPNSTSTCTARDATSRRAVTVTVIDASGTLAFTVAKAAG